MQLRPARRDRYVSKVRELLGDETITLIGFNRRLTAADRAAIEAFPEASVEGIPDSPADAP